MNEDKIKDLNNKLKSVQGELGDKRMAIGDFETERQSLDNKIKYLTKKISKCKESDELLISKECDELKKKFIILKLKMMN